MEVIASDGNSKRLKHARRARKGVPIKPGWPTTRTHDYRRHGTTNLFAAYKQGALRVLIGMLFDP